MSTLAERMREALAESGKSQTDLAKACRVRAPSVHDWLSGKTKSLKAGTAQGASEFLGVNMLWLTEGRGPKRSGDPQPERPAGAQQEIDVRALKLEALRQAVGAMAREFGVTPVQLITGDFGEKPAAVDDETEGPINLPKNARSVTSEGKADQRIRDRRTLKDRRASL